MLCPHCHTPLFEGDCPAQWHAADHPVLDIYAMFRQAWQDLQELRAVRKQLVAREHGWREQANAWCDAEVKRRKKAKAPELEIKAWNEAFCLMPVDLADRGKKLLDAYEVSEAKLERLTADLNELAQGCTPRVGSTWRKLGTGGSYHTQGLGAGRYEKGSAEMLADKARLCDVPVDVVQVCAWTPDMHTAFPKGHESQGQWTVFVAVESEADVEIVRRRPGLSLVEQVRLCWKRGVNPRVYNPYLPHGFEEKHGLDFFGNYKEKPHAA